VKLFINPFQTLKLRSAERKALVEIIINSLVTDDEVEPKQETTTQTDQPVKKEA